MHKTCHEAKSPQLPLVARMVPSALCDLGLCNLSTCGRTESSELIQYMHGQTRCDPCLFLRWVAHEMYDRRGRGWRDAHSPACRGHGLEEDLVVICHAHLHTCYLHEEDKFSWHHVRRQGASKETGKEKRYLIHKKKCEGKEPSTRPCEQV